MTAHIATVRLCRTPGCLNPYEPYANDGDGEYRTEDSDGMCASCNSRAVNCAVCGDQFVTEDPSDPDNQQCPDCVENANANRPTEVRSVSPESNSGARAAVCEVRRVVAQ